uniref:Uncharacterized protein n=1 Tax=Ananas comosus var. bracteatus TaxID=296719 RepID=A0A6V7NKQ5_ANACO|nr:unnamed protein product [Ananas comosus var. bracteatus]
MSESRQSLSMEDQQDLLLHLEPKDENQTPLQEEGDLNSNSTSKRRRYNRHTAHQIQTLEAFFKENPHPDEKQRRELGLELGLEPLQVKFWFQNKRTQTKNHHEKQDNYRLKEENETLKAENTSLKEALSSAFCPSCGDPRALSLEEHKLRVENATLREEIKRVIAITSKYVGGPSVMYQMLSSPLPSIQSMDGGVGRPEVWQGMTVGDSARPAIAQLAIDAMTELINMAQLEEPLWLRSPDSTNDILNEEEYAQHLSRGVGPRIDGLKTEATRATAVVALDCRQLIDIFMNANSYESFFSSIVSTASTVEAFPAEVQGSDDKTLQLMKAEFQFPSPLVPKRECVFLRYCKQHGEGLWAVVDVSFDGHGIITTDGRHYTKTTCRRRPSGCIIQAMQDGSSKVVWVEHVEVDDGGVHEMYKPFVNSGLAFGASQWIATIDRHVMAINNSIFEYNGDDPKSRSFEYKYAFSKSKFSFLSLKMFNMHAQPFATVALILHDEKFSILQLCIAVDPSGGKNLLKQAENMMKSFCGAISGSPEHEWTVEAGIGTEEEAAAKVMSKTINNNGDQDPNNPTGVALSACISFWLAVPMRRVFEFLRSETSRHEWDAFYDGSEIQVAEVANCQGRQNYVSILRTGGSASGDENNIMILQHSCYNTSGSFVIYAPIDATALNMVLSGGDPTSAIALLPSGFAIHPDMKSGAENGMACDGENGGSLLTVVFQIIADRSGPEPCLPAGSVSTVRNLVSGTCERIRAALSGDNGQ